MPHRIARMRIDDAITAANSTTGAGAVTGVLGWAASINWLGLTGVIIAALGFIVSLHYQRKRYRLDVERAKRERLEHEARMRQLTNGD